MNKYRILFLLMIPVVGATLFFTARITTKLSKYEEKKLEKAELLDAETRLGNAWEWLPPWLSGGDDTMDESRELDSQANAYYNSAMKDGVVLLLIVIAFFNCYQPPI